MLVSTFLLLLLALFVVGTLTKTLFSMQKSSDTSTGLMVAHSLLDSKLHQILNDDAIRDDFFSHPPGTWDAGIGSLLDGTEYRYEITVDDITLATGAPAPGNRLKSVSAVVWWWTAQKDEARPEYGRLRAELVRLVNETSRK